MPLTGSYTFIVNATTQLEYDEFLAWIEWYVATPTGIDTQVSIDTNGSQKRITITCNNAPVIIPLEVPPL